MDIKEFAQQMRPLTSLLPTLTEDVTQLQRTVWKGQPNLLSAPISYEVTRHDSDVASSLSLTRIVGSLQQPQSYLRQNIFTVAISKNGHSGSLNTLTIGGMGRGMTRRHWRVACALARDFGAWFSNANHGRAFIQRQSGERALQNRVRLIHDVVRDAEHQLANFNVYDRMLKEFGGEVISLSEHAAKSAGAAPFRPKHIAPANGAEKDRSNILPFGNSLG